MGLLAKNLWKQKGLLEILINGMNKQLTLIDNEKRTSDKRKGLVERLLSKNRNWQQ